MTKVSGPTCGEIVSALLEREGVWGVAHLPSPAVATGRARPNPVGRRTALLLLGGEGSTPASLSPPFDLRGTTRST